MCVYIVVKRRKSGEFFVKNKVGEMGRSPCCAKVGLNKGAWTCAEDKILTDFIHLNGEGRWRNLPKRAGLKRCGKSCRLRWLNYLRPDIKRGNISDDEEDLIIRLHKLLGNRWSLIAGRLPGRTDNEIKNYWNTTLRKKSRDNHTSSVSVPKTPKQNKRKVKKKLARSESTQPNHNVDSDLAENNSASKSTQSESDDQVITDIIREPVVEESPKPKDDNLSLEMELNSSDVCLKELMSSDLSGLFKSTCSSSSYERPLMEMLEEFWGHNVEPDLFTTPTTTDHCFPSLSDCVGDWLV